MKKDVHGFTLADYLLGDASAQMWIAMMILAVIMAAVMMFQRVKKRDLSSERTPDKWDWKWFIGDSIGRIFSTLFSIFLITRAMLVFADPKYIILYSIIIGLISDQLPVIFGFVKNQAIVKVKKVVTKWFGTDKVEVTTTQITTTENIKPE
jgi:uncharacterized membrane protein YfcA